MKETILAEPLPEEADLRQMLQAARSSATPWRDRVILLLLWDGPVRPDVLLRLTPTDLRLSAHRVEMPDGGCIRLSEETLAALMTFMALERDLHCARLLCGRHGHPFGPGELGRCVRRLGRQVGLEVSPWSLHLGALYRKLPALPERELVGKG